MIETTNEEQIERLNHRIAELLDEVAALKIHAQGAPTREQIARVIAGKIACEQDCASDPSGCGCSDDAADAVMVLYSPALISTDGPTKLGSSEPLGPRYDGATMDNQKLHAGPGGGMTTPDTSTDGGGK